jgi:hypothetical protein
MDEALIIQINLKGELDRSFQNNGVFQFPKRATVQLSGICELNSKELLVCDAGRKLQGKNKIFLIQPSDENTQGKFAEVIFLYSR